MLVAVVLLQLRTKALARSATPATSCHPGSRWGRQLVLPLLGTRDRSTDYISATAARGSCLVRPSARRQPAHHVSRLQALHSRPVTPSAPPCSLSALYAVASIRGVRLIGRLAEMMGKAARWIDTVKLVDQDDEYSVEHELLHGRKKLAHIIGRSWLVKRMDKYGGRCEPGG